MKEVIQTGRAPAAVGPYSQAIRAGDYLFISGQIGIDPATGTLVEGGIRRQAEVALGNISAIVETAGTGMHSVVKTTVLLQSMEDFAEMNDIYKRFFLEPYPARAAFGVGALPLGALVEIEAVVYMGA